MDRFEAELIGIVKEIKFKKMHNNIQQQMNKDIRSIKGPDYIFVKSDKSGNLYEIDKEDIGKWCLRMWLNIIGNLHQISKRNWIARPKC